jgi:D-sedoheptulose 7-phosphate isomerase
VPLITAWANDTSYEEVFAEQLAALVRPADVIVAISASGNSPNLVDGLKVAANLGARTIALLGFDGGAALRIAEIAVHVPCSDYGLAEDTHAAIGHAITMSVRRALESERSRDLVRLL